MLSPSKKNITLGKREKERERERERGRERETPTSASHDEKKEGVWVGG